MKFMKKILTAAEIGIGTGLYLLDQSERLTPRVRNRIGDQLDDFRDRAKVAYGAATDRLSHVSKSLRTNRTHSTAETILKFAAGVGIGVGVGLLMAPRRGEETRNKMAEKAQKFGSNVRQRFSSQEFAPTGTGD